METVPTCNVCRSNLPSESISVPTLVVTLTRSGDVSRTETTSTMVLRSHVRGGRSSAAISEVETRPGVEFRQEMEIENSAEIKIIISTSRERDLSAARPETLFFLFLFFFFFFFFFF